MVDQSAIRIPQGQLPLNLVEETMYLHCSPGGSDTTGDGSITNPYFHPNRALLDLERLYFTDRGQAIIKCLPGSYNFEYPVIVDNRTHKNISIQGEVGTSFILQEVTSYKYDAVENFDENGYGVGSLVDQRITVKLARASDLASPVTSPVNPAVSAEGISIEVGDYVLFKDRTSSSDVYYPTGKDGSLGSEGLTGPNPGDARTNVLGCYEIIAVNSTDNTVTFRSRGKNFLHKLGKSHISNADASISVDDNIFSGGYRSVDNNESGDPTGLYGKLFSTGIDEASGSIVSDHVISAKVLKTVFKYKRPNSTGRSGVTKGLVLKPNSTLNSVSNIVFQGDVRFKHFNELNPASSNGEGILIFNNSKLGNSRGDDSVCQDIGLSGWYAGLVAHTDSSATVRSIAISDCSFGLVAEKNSTLNCDKSTVTGCDLIGIVASKNSTISAANTTVGSAGYTPVTIDLDNVTDDFSQLDAGQSVNIIVGDGEVLFGNCIWNSLKNPFNLMRDPIRDRYNYYPFNTGNQIYIRPAWPGNEGLVPSQYTNSFPPTGIIKSGGFSYSVGYGILPEETSINQSYEPRNSCGALDEDLAGGVCHPPGFFGDEFDFLSTNDGGFFDINDQFPDQGGSDFGGGMDTQGDFDISCMACSDCDDCFGEGNAGCDPTDSFCFNACCDVCDEFACDPANGCENPPFNCDPPDPCQDVSCDDENEACNNDCCIPDPGGSPPSGEYCTWCTTCNHPTPECQCCPGREECCPEQGGDPDSCFCQDPSADCCDFDCAQSQDCHGSGCCCDSTDPGGKPCYCFSGTDICGGYGTPCEGIPGLFRECSDCPSGDCVCPPGTDRAFACPDENGSCNDTPPPSGTTYRLVDHPIGIGFLSHGGSTIKASRSFVALLRNAGFLAMENSDIDANLAFARGCAGPGFFSRENSTINARNSSAQRTRGGYNARTNSNIQAQMIYATDNADHNFVVHDDSIIDCSQATTQISRTVSGTVASEITTENKIYSGMAIAHGEVKRGSFINKTGIVRIPLTNGPVDNREDFFVDSTSNIDPPDLN